MKAAAPAFAASLHFFPLEQSHRKNFPFQGYRPSLQFATGIWIPDYVWPEFFYKDGTRVPDQVEVPSDVEAYMYTWSDDVLPILLSEVREGASFRMTEGPFQKYLVGVGIVKKIGPYLKARRNDSK